MALQTPIVSLFGQEWERLKEGLALLDPNSAEAYEERLKNAKRNPEGLIAINIPGWDDVIRLGARQRPDQFAVAEYWQAKREKRPPNVAAWELRELQRRETVKQRMAQSAQPDYARAMGSILTAVDNVQDFLSTVATTGRLALWGLPRAMQMIVPGASTGTADALAQVAARRAAAQTAAAFAETVAGRAAAGELVARLALRDAALYAAAERSAVREAAAVAYRLAFSRATLGLTARLAGRFVPVVGWILLASDVLNLLSLLGMMASPAYALACAGPQTALAAGIPAALFKRALKAETWSMHNLNPFSRQARATRQLRAAGRLPGVANLIEVAQTTDQLFGVGASFGGLVGMLNESMFGAAAYADGQTVQVNLPGAALPVSDAARKKFRALPPREQRLVQEAGTVALTANAVWRVQEVWDEEEHLTTAIASLEATAVLYWFWHDLPFHDSVAQLAERELPAPLNVSLDTRLWAEHVGVDLEAHRRWWFDGAPKMTTGAAYTAAHARPIAAAIADFLRPRRDAPAGALFGALVTQHTDYSFMLLENDPDFLKWSLTTDARLVSGFAEAGWVLPTPADEAAVWRMWTVARAELERSGRPSLPAARWPAIAAASGVTLLRMLPPEASVPAAWAVGPLEHQPQP